MIATLVVFFYPYLQIVLLVLVWILVHHCLPFTLPYFICTKTLHFRKWMYVNGLYITTPLSKTLLAAAFATVTQQKLAENDNWVVTKCIIFAGMFLHILTGMVLVALLPLTYVCLILLYQFVVARSEANQLAYSNLSTYVPSLVSACCVRVYN